MTTCVITLWHEHVQPLTTSLSAMCYHYVPPPKERGDILKFIFKAIKSLLEQSYDKQNLALVVFSYENNETPYMYCEIGTQDLFVTCPDKALFRD